MGQIDFGGVVREACLDYVPEAKVGDYTLIHVGFALNIISEQEAQETLELLQQISDIDEELRASETNNQIS
jgi:hydrogenase expression/formation protein HypC